MSRRRVWIPIALGAGIAIAGGGALLLTLEDKPSAPVAVDRSLARFRADWAAVGRGEPRGTATAVPRAGVYVYTARGFERATVLGRSARHEYPARVTLTVLPSSCGLSARLDLLGARSSTWQVCARGGAWQLTRFRDVHRFFDRLDDRTYRCDAGSTWLALRGTWGARCAIAGTTQHWTAREVSRGLVDVAGRRLPAVRVRLSSQTRGDTEGTGTEYLWLLRETGLPARWLVANTSATRTFVGQVRYREAIDLRLAALSPRR